ncbi:MAG: S41 family peptidase [Clostridia bacterium]|nr:S41 family peptidase [Clostridia bacterium]
MKANNKAVIICTICITALITFSGTIFGYYHYLEAKNVIIDKYESNGDIASDLDVVRTVLSKYYKGDIEDDKLKEAAIKGYVDGLGDEYTTYMTETELDSLETSLSDYSGIGCYVGKLKTTDETIIIGFVKENSPAERAGIKEGDIIVKIDGEDVDGMKLEKVTSKMKGTEGTNVNVTIKRDGNVIEIPIVRERIKLYEISHKVINSNNSGVSGSDTSSKDDENILNGDIGYIDFDSFTEGSYDEFKAAYEDIEKKGAKKLIIDLRNNTGGYVTSALKIADLIIPEGETLLVTEDKDGKRQETKAEKSPEIDIPIVVIVNNNSASASEILTAILKDYGKATVIGKTTYGKGVIQTIIPNILGGALKVTSYEYYTPKGNKINKIGIKPDVEVEDNKSTPEDEAILKAIEVLKENQ